MVVNLFGGPGVSKSTNMALIFGKLKAAGVNAEMGPEYAKDLVWEQRSKALNFQPYIIAKQMYRIQRLLGQVECIISDSPILFGLVYGENNDPYWERWVLNTFQSWDTENFHLVRDNEFHPYNPKGRTQTAEEAVVIDQKIENLLVTHEIDHTVVKVQEGEKAANEIVEHLMDGIVF